MEFKRIPLIFLAFLLSVTAASAQETGPLTDEADCIELCDRVMEMVVREDYRRVFEMLSAISVPQIRGQVYDLRTTTEDQIEAVKSQYGEIIGFVEVSRRNIAETLLEIVYVQTFENHGLRWEFVFYRPGDVWKLDNVEWDDQMTKVFD
jgi:hypothetical protein